MTIAVVKKFGQPEKGKADVADGKDNHIDDAVFASHPSDLSAHPSLFYMLLESG